MNEASKKNYPYLVIGLLLLLFVGTVRYFRQQERVVTDLVIAEDIQRLAGIFARIHQSCTIINFEHQRNYVDFLNVVSFKGSEVGSMNIANPQGWQGPYVDDNPTMQAKYYEVVRTQRGYYIVPGKDVRLGSGKIIGKDIIFDEQADVPALLEAENDLMYEGRALVAPVMTQIL